LYFELNDSSAKSTFIDEWQSQGRIMWLDAFDNQVSSMAIFEASE